MPLPAGASVGVALFPDHASTAEELMKKSDIAMYEAKHGGRKMACVFDAPMQAKINDARLLELEMQLAIEQEQFEPWFQPIENIVTGQVTSYEALARWLHPQRGIIQPNRFIPIAEHTGMILAIGEQILEKACRAAKNWEPHLTVAVNPSPVQFRRPQLLVDTVKRVLERAQLEPSRLYLEITETLMMEDTTQTRLAIEELALLGVRFSLDDFGAGYSSLSYIQSYPFKKKIDKKFIDRIDSDKTSSAIVAAIGVLASRIDLEIVAEGVETQLQHATLRELGLTLAQGFLYGRPSPRVVSAPRLRAAGM
jgi:predicted signal transduction protein with EAL and GGDEF domain